MLSDPEKFVRQVFDSSYGDFISEFSDSAAAQDLIDLRIRILQYDEINEKKLKEIAGEISRISRFAKSLTLSDCNTRFARLVRKGYGVRINDMFRKAGTDDPGRRGRYVQFISFAALFAIVFAGAYYGSYYFSGTIFPEDSVDAESEADNSSVPKDVRIRYVNKTISEEVNETFNFSVLTHGSYHKTNIFTKGRVVIRLENIDNSSKEYMVYLVDDLGDVIRLESIDRDTKKDFIRNEPEGIYGVHGYFKITASGPVIDVESISPSKRLKYNITRIIQVPE